jgi:hypothetical protein
LEAVLFRELRHGSNVLIFMQKRFSRYMPNSDSSRIDELKQFLADKTFGFISEIRPSYSGKFHFTIFVSADRVSRRAGKGLTSEAQLSLVARAIKEELDLEIQWVITPSDQADALEAALRKLIEQRYPHAVASIYISSPKIAPVSVWVEMRREVERLPTQNALETIVKEFFDLFDVKEVAVICESDHVPTDPMILRRIKKSAPVKISELAGDFQAQGFVIPNERWLNSRLDRLRKKGLLIRSAEGTYVLSEAGTRTVPHNRNRSSSDIERALALGRRKW